MYGKTRYVYEFETIILYHSYVLLHVTAITSQTHEIMFRGVEVGVSLWFPCMLWNCIQPDQLWDWIPCRNLKKAKKSSAGAGEPIPGCSRELEALVDGKYITDVPADGPTTMNRLAECFICYDSDRADAGPLIKPCACKGDVAVVHHDCLKTWLMEVMMT